MTKYHNVLPFNKDNLIESFLNKKERTENSERNDIKINAINRLKKNSHIKFIHKLLEEELECKTIVIEYDYTDLDYLHDFAFYHVRCHEKYESVCTRLHFFKKEITEDSFLDLLGLIEPKKQTRQTRRTKNINEFYLGFIVARPLPKTIIGRTILIPPSRNDITYFCTREYSANLFGIQLSIPGSLAFQQQDRSVAACATIALWSAFHKVSDLFTTTLPQASTITQSATVSYSEHRSFPSKGLTIQQMRNAITNLGLEAQIQQGGFTSLMPAIYAYMKMDIPIILNMSCIQEETDEKETKQYRYIGEHAITLVGHKNSTIIDSGSEKLVMNIRNNLISHLSVHDDQIGPFTMLSVIRHEGNEGLFGKLSVLANNSAEAKKVSKDLFADRILLCYDSNHDNKNERSLFVPSGFLIPIYQKIRVSYADVYENFSKFYDIFRICYVQFLSKKAELSGNKKDEESLIQEFNHILEWEILLTTSNELKKEIKDVVNKRIERYPNDMNNVAMANNARKILLSQHPKYVWRIILRSSETEEIIFDVYADATGTPQAFPFYSMMWYQDQTKLLIQAGINKETPNLEKYTDDPEFEFLKKNSCE